MLVPAIAVAEELQTDFKHICMLDELKWLQAGWTDTTLEILDSDWSKIQMVSLNSERTIIGYFCATINRDGYFIDSLQCLNLSKYTMSDIMTRANRTTFSIDLYKFMKDLVKGRKMRKVNWSVIIGNPIEKQYDRIAKQVGAKIVGTKRYDVFIRGSYYDRKMYEWINDYYECTHCGHRQKKEEEVMCWKCGLGEMVYHNPFEY